MGKRTLGKGRQTNNNISLTISSLDLNGTFQKLSLKCAFHTTK